MAKRNAFLLRIDPRVLAGIRQWADDDLRSMNGQVEYLLRKALVNAGRWKPNDDAKPGDRRPT